jgi:addiction module HigA family antidote
VKHSSRSVAPPKISSLLKACVENIDGLTQERLADVLDVSRHTVNELFNDKRTITPIMALKLAYVLDTDAELWLNLQQARDLFNAREEFESAKPRLKVIRRDRTSEEPRRRAAG